jgi:hypothetical protein
VGRKVFSLVITNPTKSYPVINITHTQQILANLENTGEGMDWISDMVSEKC